jgi:hypothetical protein
MAIGRGAMVAVALTLLASPGAGQPAAPEAPRETIVPIYLSATRALMVVTIGDRPPVPVVFDTGTEDNLLQRTYVEAMHFAPVGTTTIVDGANGSATSAPVVALPEARLGGQPVRDLRAASFPYREEEAIGVFGPNSFSGNLVYVELGRSRLRLRPKSAAALPRGEATPYLDGLPAARIEVAGMSLAAHLDSGNDSTLFLPRALIGRLAFHAPPTIVGRARSASGEQDLYGARLRGDVRIGPILLHDPEVTFIDGPNANVGLPVIRRLTILLDPEGRRDWILQPPALGPAALHAYAGRYGARTIRVERGTLSYQRDGRSPVAFAPIGEDLFENPANGDRLQFRREGGRVVGFDLIADGGQIVAADRS